MALYAVGSNTTFDNLKIGFDTADDQGGNPQADDDIDDAGDDLLVNEAFSSTSVTAAPTSTG